MKYTVIVAEAAEIEVEVDADNSNDAEATAYRNYHDGEYDDELDDTREITMLTRRKA